MNNTKVFMDDIDITETVTTFVNDGSVYGNWASGLSGLSWSGSGTATIYGPTPGWGIEITPDWAEWTADEIIDYFARDLAERRPA